MIAKRHIGYLLLALMAGIAVLLVIMMGLNDVRDRKTPEKAASPTAMMPTHTTRAHLYFAHKKNQFLMAEDRLLKSSETPEFFARSIIEALIKGPQQGLARTIPAETDLRAIYVAAGGVCFVDLTSAVAEKHPGGIQSELMTIFSIVNTLVLNVSEIKAVKILINGNESLTLAGHIDLQTPIKPNMLLIR